MKTLAWLLTFFIGYAFTSTTEPKPLEIGAAAPDFNLKGTDGKMYSLSSFSKAKILVIVFTCNHCPTAQAYEERLKKLVTDYATKGVQVVAISPNDPLSVRLDELFVFQQRFIVIVNSIVCCDRGKCLCEGV